MSLSKFSSSLPYEAFDFKTIQESDFLPAAKEAMELTKKRIETIKSETSPSFENTIVVLESSQRELQKVTSVFFNLLSAETNETLQGIARELSPMLSDFHNDIILDPDLFQQVDRAVQHTNSESLNAEERILLDKTYKRFKRNGANLSNDDKEVLRTIDRDLSAKKLMFSDNVLKETNDYVLEVTDEYLLEGLPQHVIEDAKEKATQLGKPDMWAFTLQFPSYVPFMTYCKNRKLRKEMATAFGQRAFKGNEYDNSQLIAEIAQLRHQRAQILGYDTHADFVLEERMAKDKQTVFGFLNDLLEAATPAAEQDIADVRQLANELDGIEDLGRHDIGYYAELLKKKQLDIDDNALKPYFELEQTLNGMLQVAQKLYGLQFTPTTEIPTYHADVRTYEVHDDDKNFVSLFYVDLFPREGKRAGAWMTSFKEAFTENGTEHRPHISIVCNFTRPGKSSPSLLTFTEVTTLFHEFGHALHGMLGKGQFASLTGTNVSWDFVELPSQIMENWCYEKECLDGFAKHYQTGEAIPAEMVAKLKESLTFQEGYKTLRQLSFGLLDMAWHTNQYAGENITEFEEKAMAKSHLLPYLPGTAQSPAFSHIFSGGYSAGYYSYKWAEVLDADAFAYFLEKGLFNAEVADRFKTYVLEAGGTEKPEILYERFRGRQPKIEALKVRAGFVK